MNKRLLSSFLAASSAILFVSVSGSASNTTKLSHLSGIQSGSVLRYTGTSLLSSGDTSPILEITYIPSMQCHSYAVIYAAEGNENEFVIKNATNTENGVAYAYADFSNIVKNCDRYTIEYDSWLTRESAARIEIADLSKRPGQSSKDGIDTTGVAFSHGVRYYYEYVVNDSIAVGNYSSALDSWVHTRIDVDTDANTVTYAIYDDSENELLSGTDIGYFRSDTDPTGITYIDYVNSKEARLKNIKVITEKTGIGERYASFMTASGNTVVSLSGINSGVLTAVQYENNIPKTIKTANINSDIVTIEGITADKVFIWESFDSLRPLYNCLSEPSE